MRNPEFKSNKKRSWIEFFTNLRTIRFGAEGTRLFMQVGEGTVAFLDPNAI